MKMLKFAIFVSAEQTLRYSIFYLTFLPHQKYKLKNLESVTGKMQITLFSQVKRNKRRMTQIKQ